jgi:hypothetical protein
MRLALTVMIGAALFGVAAGFQPVLPATRGAAARSGRSRAAPHASCVAARRACSSARVYGAAQLVRMRAHAHEAPSAPVRGISGSPATPWARLKQVAFGLLAAVSPWRGSRRWPRLHDARAGLVVPPVLACLRAKKGPRGLSPGRLIVSCPAGQERPARSWSRAADRFLSRPVLVQGS